MFRLINTESGRILTLNINWEGLFNNKSMELLHWYSVVSVSGKLIDSTFLCSLTSVVGKIRTCMIQPRTSINKKTPQRLIAPISGVSLGLSFFLSLSLSRYCTQSCLTMMAGVGVTGSFATFSVVLYR